jgi:hypothetical protein
VVQPSNATKNVGEQATFSMAATGTPILHYAWYRNGVLIPGAPDLNVYSTPVLTSGDNGAKYKCMVSNGYGSATTNEATLTVSTGSTAPTITTHPASASVAVGEPVTFVVVASGSPTLTYQWYKAPDGTTAGVPISGATSASYTITSTVSGDAGYYYCTVTNSYGSATSNRAQLTVGAAGADVYITITTPTSIAFVGEPCTVTITDPAAKESEPTHHIATVDTSDTSHTFTSSYGPATGGSYTAGTNGTIIEVLPTGFTSYSEYWKFDTFVDPGYAAAPTLHVKVAGCQLKAGLAGASTIAIDVYYGSTFITNLKTYSSSTIAGENFTVPQDLTAVLNTTGGYPTYALMMAALNIRVVFSTRASSVQSNTNSITFDYGGIKTIGS